jgi:hypothetical protein
MDNFSFSPLGYFSRPFFFFSRKLFHSHGQFVRAATRRLGESKKGVTEICQLTMINWLFTL